MSADTARFEHLLHTAKQRAYSCDFLATWEQNEFWDTAEIGRSVKAEGVFVVTEEDVLDYNLAMGETHPLFLDREHARAHAPRGTLLVHPMFATAVFFWFAQPGQQGSWIRTPGARNPFQRMDLSDRITIGDQLTLVQENSDRYWRRGKAYIEFTCSIFDQNDTLKTVCTGSLILPPDREAVRAYATARGATS